MRPWSRAFDLSAAANANFAPEHPHVASDGSYINRAYVLGNIDLASKLSK